MKVSGDITAKFCPMDKKFSDAPTRARVQWLTKEFLQTVSQEQGSNAS